MVPVSGRPEHYAWLRNLGASRVLRREALVPSDRLLERAVRKDAVGAAILADITRSVTPWSNIASVGLASDQELRATVILLILESAGLVGIA